MPTTDSDKPIEGRASVRRGPSEALEAHVAAALLGLEPAPEEPFDELRRVRPGLGASGTTRQRKKPIPTHGMQMLSAGLGGRLPVSWARARRKHLRELPAEGAIRSLPPLASLLPYQP